jgi:hypothetical protein
LFEQLCLSVEQGLIFLCDAVSDEFEVVAVDFFVDDLHYFLQLQFFELRLAQGHNDIITFKLSLG